MCGIAGLLEPNGPVDPSTLDRFTDSLAHRGPDGRGTWIDGGTGLGHRRLAILGLGDAGRNPMAYGGARGDRYWIVYNGEVYNYLELKRELEARGHRFGTATDTEVVLAAYAEWGEACFPRFNGMWALALWDREERRLLLARDRFGIKPLFWTRQGGRFAFASELKAFRALDGFECRMDHEIAAATLQAMTAIEGRRSEALLRDVRRLMPGHLLTVRTGEEPVIRRWWNTLDHLPSDVPDRYEDQVALFRELFLDAVRLRLRSDVPVGASLSGGVDSGAVASAIAWLGGTGERRAGNVAAFIADFPGTVLDERVYADAVVEHAGLRAHRWTFDADEAVGHVVDSVWAMEEISGAIAVPVWAVYREMRRQGVAVSLDGHGGDELLCGYHFFLDWPMRTVNDNLFREFHQDLLPSILRNFDRCSMAHGVEVRMPLMDWRLVCLAFALPPTAKVGAGHTKRILRDAMTGIMPDSVRWRRSKIGFNSPMIEWFNGGLAPLIRELVRDPLWDSIGLWDGPGLREAILAKTDARAWTVEDWSDTLHHWAKMSLVLWHRLFIDGTPASQLRGSA